MSQTTPPPTPDDPELAYAAAQAWLVETEPAAQSTGPGLVARLGAEAFGTFFLVFAGVGVALYASLTGIGGGTLAVALAFGIAVMAGIIAVGHVSGGHFNPAVTFGAAIAGRMSWRDVLPYWLAQIVGGTVGAAVIFLLVPKALPAAVDSTGAGTVRSFFSGASNGFGEHSPLGTLSSGQVSFSLVSALLVEAVATAIFVGVILGATDRRANVQHVPFAVGLALSILILVAIPVTNASLNPARSLATAIFSESWALQQVWLFWVAPLLGAAIAALVYRAFVPAPQEDKLFAEDDDEDGPEDDELIVIEKA